jgi:hypothetical protein
MGWDYQERRGRTRKQCRAAMLQECFGDRVLAWESVHDEVYAAIRSKDDPAKIIGVVFLTNFCHMSGLGDSFGYQGMDEGMHPFNYNCPESILDMLTPTDSEWANKWRQECRNTHRRLAEYKSMQHSIASAR